MLLYLRLLKCNRIPWVFLPNIFTCTHEMDAALAELQLTTWLSNSLSIVTAAAAIATAVLLLPHGRPRRWRSEPRRSNVSQETKAKCFYICVRNPILR